MLVLCKIAIFLKLLYTVGTQKNNICQLVKKHKLVVVKFHLELRTIVSYLSNMNLYSIIYTYMFLTKQKFVKNLL